MAGEDGETGRGRIHNGVRDQMRIKYSEHLLVCWQ
jgi:hypothetical protein